MIIANICGGLGNQMFQFANAYALAKNLNRKLALCTDMIGTFDSSHNGFELERVFNISVPVLDKFQRDDVFGLFSSVTARKLISRSPFRFLQPKNFLYESVFVKIPEQQLKFVKNLYLEGYWQSEVFFSSRASDIRSLYQFDIVCDESNSQTLQQITATNSLAIHVRRGDYISNDAAANLHGIPSVDYYYRAIDYVSRCKGPVEIFAFSDDPGWVRDTFAGSYPTIKIVDHNTGNKSHIDMYLMSQCKHIVTANSTFSWWAAWLNQHPERLIVAPKNWFASKSEPDNLIPKTWIRL